MAHFCIPCILDENALEQIPCFVKNCIELSGGEQTLFTLKKIGGEETFVKSKQKVELPKKQFEKKQNQYYKYRAKAQTIEDWQAKDCSFCHSKNQLQFTHNKYCNEFEQHMFPICMDCILEGKDDELCPVCRILDESEKKYLKFHPSSLTFIQLIPQERLLSIHSKMPMQNPQYASICEVDTRMFLRTGGIYMNHHDFEVNQSAECQLFDFRNFNKGLYDVKNVPNLPLSRHMHSSVNIGDYVYVFGGLHSSNFGELHYLKNCERINISKDNVGKWEKVADMNIARSQFSVAVIDNRIYAFGGFTGFQQVTNTVEIYDPKKNLWQVIDLDSQEGQEESLLANSICVKVDEPVGYYIIGGTNGKKASNKALKFNPENNYLTLATTFKWVDKENKTQNDVSFSAPTVIKDSQDLYIFGGTLEKHNEEIQYFVKGVKYNTSNQEKQEINIPQHTQIQLIYDSISQIPALEGLESQGIQFQ